MTRPNAWNRPKSPPFQPLLPQGEKGELERPDAWNERWRARASPKTHPCKVAAPGSARLRRACERGRPRTRLRLRRACGRGRPRTQDARGSIILPIALSSENARAPKGLPRTQGGLQPARATSRPRRRASPWRAEGFSPTARASPRRRASPWRAEGLWSLNT